MDTHWCIIHVYVNIYLYKITVLIFGSIRTFPFRFKISLLKVKVSTSELDVPIEIVELPPIVNGTLSLGRSIFFILFENDSVPVHFEKSPKTLRIS